MEGIATALGVGYLDILVQHLKDAFGRREAGGHEVAAAADDLEVGVEHVDDTEEAMSVPGLPLRIRTS